MRHCRIFDLGYGRRSAHRAEMIGAVTGRVPLSWVRQFLGTSWKSGWYEICEANAVPIPLYQGRGQQLLFRTWRMTEPCRTVCLGYPWRITPVPHMISQTWSPVSGVACSRVLICLLKIQIRWKKREKYLLKWWPLQKYNLCPVLPSVFYWKSFSSSLPQENTEDIVVEVQTSLCSVSDASVSW